MTSFSKAKIHRFNEEVSCAPPPGRYDPKLDTKIKGAVVLSAKRFPDQVCTSVSLDSLDKSNCDKVTFRTPQVVKKVVPLTPRLKYLQEKKFDTPGSGSSTASSKSLEKLPSCLPVHTGLKRSEYQRLEQELSAQAEKHLIELQERDREVTKLKEDLEKIKCHENELQIILEEKCVVASERNKELLEVKSNLDTFVVKINEERETNKKYIDELKQEILNLQTEKEELQSFIEVKQSAIVIVNEKLLKVENELKALREDKEKHELYIANIMETHKEIVDKIISGCEQKTEVLEKNLKAKVKSIEQQFDDAQHKTQVDFQTNLNLVSHEFELKKNEVANHLQKCLLELKQLDEMVGKKEAYILNSIAEVDERCRYIYRKLCEVEGQRDELLVSDLEKNLAMISIQEKSDLFENDLKLCKERCKKFEITLNSMRNTISALSHRLFESESEVERLSNVEVDLENQKKLLEEKSQLLIADITALRGSMDSLEKDIICDVSAMKEHLTSKVEYFKAEAAKQEGLLNSRIQEKQFTIDVLLEKNEYFKAESERKEEHLSELRHKLKTQEKDVVCLRNECSRMEDELSKNLTALSAQENVCSVLSGKLLRANEIISDLERLKTTHENQVRTLLEEINQYKAALLDAEQKLMSAENDKIVQSNEINALRQEIQTHTEIIRNMNKNEEKLHQNIDELISDLVLEKERCVTAETENEQFKTLLSDIEIRNNDKDEEITELTSKIETLERSLKNAEDKISVIEEAKTTVETQLIESENNVKELKNILFVAEEQLEKRIEELQVMLNSTKEKIKIELPKLQQDNINKAQNILELSVKIDSLKENVTDSVAKISSLEEENRSLSLQLEEANKVISGLKHIEAKNIHELYTLEEKISEYRIKITCLEAEKNSLSVYLEESKSHISDLETAIGNKNKAINTLIIHKNIAEADYKKSLQDIDRLHVSENKLNDMLKLQLENGMELSKQLEKTEEERNEFQEMLSVTKSELSRLKSEDFENDNKKLKEELETLKLRMQVVIDERDKADAELAQLMGHQNIHQKIKHVTQLKQANIELRERADNLEIENQRLKKKLDEIKENSNIHYPENTKKTPHLKRGKTALSPAVLRDKNSV